MMKKTSRLLCVTLAFTMSMGVLVACGQGNEETNANETKYNDACALIESGEYERAYAAFKELGDYKDSQKYLSKFIYFPTVANFTLYDRSGVMTVELGAYNMPTHMLTEGFIGTDAYTKDGVYTYDGKGNLMQQAVTYNDTLLTYDYTYDDKNRLIKAVYSEAGEEISFNDYEYDENGLLVREAYVEGDIVHYNYMNSYDANGKLIKAESDGEEFDYEYTYTYNDKGDWEQSTGRVLEAGTVVYWYVNDYTYNTAGQLTKKVLTEDGEISETTDYTYDNAGNCIKEECTYPDGSKQVFTREFDANGNVSKEVLIHSDGTEESVVWQYALTYLTIDVPDATMNQMLGMFDIL